MTVEKGSPLLVKAGIEQEQESRDQREGFTSGPDSPNHCPSEDTRKRAQEQRVDLPIDRNVRQDEPIHLIKQAPHGTVR